MNIKTTVLIGDKPFEFTTRTCIIYICGIKKNKLICLKQVGIN